MSHITIYGYPSFQAWVEAGMPGSVNSKTGQINHEPDAYRVNTHCACGTLIRSLSYDQCFKCRHATVKVA